MGGRRTITDTRKGHSTELMNAFIARNQCGLNRIEVACLLAACRASWSAEVDGAEVICPASYFQQRIR